MANSKKSAMGKKPVAMIILAVLLALTVFVCVFGVSGCHKEGALYYYQNWIPACVQEMPEGLTLDRALGGETILYYQTAGAEDGADVAAAAEKMLKEAEVTDFETELDGNVLKVHLPADADAFAAELVLYSYQTGPTLSSSSVSLNKEYFVSASLKAGSPYSTTADTLSIRLSEEALKLFEANGVTAKSMFTFAVSEMGLSLTLYNSSYSSSTYTPFDLNGDTISFPVNAEGRAYFNAVAAYINCDKMPATLTETTPAEMAAAAADTASAEADPAAETAVAAETAEKADKPSAAVPVIILWAAFLAAAVLLFVKFRKNGLAGIWAVLLFIVYIFFMLADVLYKSGFLGYITYILTVVCMLFVAFSSAMLLDAIAGARVAGQPDRPAIGAGYRNSRKLFYLINAAVLAVGFVFAFIPALALAGFIMMLTVLGNIALNRVFVPGVLYLLNTVLG